MPLDDSRHGLFQNDAEDRRAPTVTGRSIAVGSLGRDKLPVTGTAREPLRPSVVGFAVGN